MMLERRCSENKKPTRFANSAAAAAYVGGDMESSDGHDGGNTICSQSLPSNCDSLEQQRQQEQEQQPRQIQEQQEEQRLEKTTTTTTVTMAIHQYSNHHPMRQRLLLGGEASLDQEERLLSVRRRDGPGRCHMRDRTRRTVRLFASILLLATIVPFCLSFTVSFHAGHPLTRVGNHRPAVSSSSSSSAQCMSTFLGVVETSDTLCQLDEHLLGPFVVPSELQSHNYQSLFQQRPATTFAAGSSSLKSRKPGMTIPLSMFLSNNNHNSHHASSLHQPSGWFPPLGKQQKKIDDDHQRRRAEYPSSASSSSSSLHNNKQKCNKRARLGIHFTDENEESASKSIGSGSRNNVRLQASSGKYAATDPSYSSSSSIYEMDIQQLQNQYQLEQQSHHLDHALFPSVSSPSASSSSSFSRSNIWSNPTTSMVSDFEAQEADGAGVLFYEAKGNWSSSLALEEPLSKFSSKSSSKIKSKRERFEQQHVKDEQQKAPKKTPANAGTLKANSLAEWARTLDVQQLLDRRQAIHREKNEGKKIIDTAAEKSTRQSRTSPTASTVDDLKKAFSRPQPTTSEGQSLNNLEVKELYMASKHADQVGDRALSKSILLQLKQVTPNDARIYRRLARLEKEDGNVSGARAVLQEGLRLHPQNAFLWHGLAQVTPPQMDNDRKKYWRRAIQADPSFPHAYHALGTLEHSQGRIAMAMKTLKKGIEYCPTNHRLHHALGDLYRDAKMLDMAEKSYRKSLQHAPPVSHGFAFTALAYVAYEQGEIDRCRSWLQKSIQLNNGRHANGWVALAQMEESEGNVDAARAVCVAGIAQYERGLLERSAAARAASRSKQSNSQSNNKYSRDTRGTTKYGADRSASSSSSSSMLAQALANATDPISLKDELMKRVPFYRSGDRFFNVYRNWARLEERYGTLESARAVYKRAGVAFPAEWKLSLDEASYYVKLKMHDQARQVFSEACRRASNRHADPYRTFAEFEMKYHNYEAARVILYSGATAMSQAADGATGNACGLAELFHTWAVCEWHLGEIERAEVLFDHALRMTDAGDEGSKLRSFILYSIARLEHFRDEHLLAQHCIGLCLKENVMPGGNSKIWELWADVATAMRNKKLAEKCSEYAEQARSHEDRNGPHSLMLLRLLDSSTKNGGAPASSGLARMKGHEMAQLMRRDPWHQKLFGVVDDGAEEKVSSFFHGVRLPEKKN